MQALQPHVRAFGLPQRELEEIIDGMEMDLSMVRYQRFQDLLRYCHHVAGVVGQLAARIFGHSDEKTLEYAHELGIAFQLTNIIRDVGEDARRDRIYLPMEELQRFNCPAMDILHYEESAAFKALMEFQIERAQQYYRQAWELLPAADRKAQRPGLLMAAIYRATLEEIKLDGPAKVLNQRLSLTPSASCGWHGKPGPSATGREPRMSGPRIAVIGAGWAGLAAAVELAGRAQLTVFEAAGRPGAPHRRARRRLDNGQHILIGAYRECLRLMATVGVDEREALLRLPMRWQRQGGISLRCPRLPAPLHLVAGLLTARGIGWRDKGRLALALQRLKRQAWRVEPDCAAAQWLAEQGQSETLIREFWRPLVLSGLNTPLELASMRVLAAVLRDSLGATAPPATCCCREWTCRRCFPIRPGNGWRRAARICAPAGVRGVATDSAG